MRKFIAVYLLSMVLATGCIPIQPLSPENAHWFGSLPATPQTLAESGDRTSAVLLMVAGEPVTISQFQTRVRLQRLEWEMQIERYKSLVPEGIDAAEFMQFFPIAVELEAALDDPKRLAQVALDALLEVRVATAEAERRGLLLDEMLVQDVARSDTIRLAAEFNDLLRTPPDIESQTLEQRREAAEAFLEPLFVERGLTVADWRALSAAKVCVAEVFDAVGADVVPVEGPQVHVLEAVFPNAQHPEQRARAAEFYERWQAGEEFAALSAEFELPILVPANSGETEWVSPGTRWPGWEEAVVDIEDGGIGKPFETLIGLHIVKVIERSESRPHDPGTLYWMYKPVYDAWLAEHLAQIELPPLARLLEVMPE